jgi:hypothetical protein
MIEEESGLRATQSIPPPDASRQVNPAGGREEVAAFGPPAPERSSFAPVENTELERRVLAHERILQALIAHLAEGEPRFLDRLSETFCVPLQRSRAEHDYTDTDSYAAEFIGTVVRLGKDAARKRPAAAAVRKPQAGARSTDAIDLGRLFPLPRIQVCQAGGVWRITRDGHFYGDFHEEQDALEAAEVAGRAALPA